MRNFCTLFDSHYIHKGISLYLSLERVAGDFQLYVMAFDRDCYNKLTELAFPKMIVEYLEDFETPELLAVKPTRSRMEYCWTCGPSVIHHFMTKNRLPDITYLDADLYFYNDPQIAYDEIGNKSVAITEQYYLTGEFEGKYCVQFMYFKNDTDGIGCLEWWRDRCLEWCYARYEDGKLGDQKYLESFPVLFNNVHVIENRAVPMAPWNMDLYTYENGRMVYEGVSKDIVFFHFHGTKSIIKNNHLILWARYSITKDQNSLFFTPYAKQLLEVYNTYLGYHLKTYSVRQRSLPLYIVQKVKMYFRKFSIVRFLYYKVFHLAPKGREKKQI